jgi:protein required for attachment to host cells
MILPTGATVAVADGETVRLFRNTGVKLGVHLVEIRAAPPASAHSGSGARHITPALPTPMAGGSTRTTSRQLRPRS